MTDVMGPGGHGGEPEPADPRVGRFAMRADTGVWRWSAEAGALHGIAPELGAVTTADVLDRVHEADRATVRAAVERCLADGEPFSAHYRLPHGPRPRRVVLVGEGRGDTDGAVAGLHGFLVDVTARWDREVDRAATSQVRRARVTQEVIDQARGVLMLLYGLDADAALAVLTWQSQRTNVKVRDLARQLVEVGAREAWVPEAVRGRLDALFQRLPLEPGPPPAGPPGPAGPAAPAGPAPADAGPASAAGPPSAADRPAGPRAALAVVARRTARGTAIELAGVVDLATAPELERRLARETARAADGPEVVVDLRAVRRLGPAGISVLRSAQRRCARAGLALRVVASAGQAAETQALTAAGLDVRQETAERPYRPAGSPQDQDGPSRARSES